MTHQPALYSLRTDGDQFRITKFVDGEVESSYLCTAYECTCPAGHRPSCRHRQMIPNMLAHHIVDTHWFFNFDTNRVVDFNGELKSNLDALNELAHFRTHTVGAAPPSSGQEDALPAGPQDEELPDEAYLDCDDQAPPVQMAKPGWRRL